MKLLFETIPADGSIRLFMRTYVRGNPFICMLNPINEAYPNENDSYYYIGRHLYQKGIPVPKIYLYYKDYGIFWIEDLVNTHLQGIVDFENKTEGTIECYEKILDILARLAIYGYDGFDARYCYDTPIYDAKFIIERELNYFHREFLLSYMRMSPPNGIEKDFVNLAKDVAGIQNNFLMHRDFQSRNIMVKDGKFFIIDFQGARYGPPTYDLASLLIDPYVEIPIKYKLRLVADYFSAIEGYIPYSRDEFMELFWKTALCRNMQVLAAFSFLSIKRGKAFFKRFIGAGIREMKIVLSYIGLKYPIISNLIFDMDQKYCSTIR